ncbi:sugar MFS transporter [Sphingobacterium sp. lm-10]|uniref:sugar MFS transporter n=1 Tax=Sphingobacterium sp. lm-10 TaxID=2944904 RepID=UPI0020223B17|nr:sugar MFS transporter [Sphingobacterium sp. lm-10]MCL7989416.1 sugar MFS transporter [Sphingobacterium sp. lm-10]
MKIIPTQQPSSTLGPMIIIGSLFFIFGFVTWLNSLLIPYLKIACELSETQSYLVTFAFYISYLVMAPISAKVLKRYGFKKGMGISLAIMALGAALFIPAAFLRAYELFLLGLFTIGGGLAILQTASNPYITILGPVESAAKRISIMGIFNKLAGAAAPIVLGFFLNLDEADKIASQVNSLSKSEHKAALDAVALQVVHPYMGIVLVLAILAYFIIKSNLPEVEPPEEEVEDSLSEAPERNSIWAHRQIVLGFIALFMYVGVEVIAGDTIIAYGKSLGIPLSQAKFFTGLTMSAMISGYLIGIWAIPRFIAQEVALKWCAILGMIFTVIIVSTTGMVSLAFVAMLGLANSLVWPAIWPLALRGMGRLTPSASGLLVMGIAGGAVLPLAYGQLSQLIGNTQAYWIVFPSYLFVLYYATLGHRTSHKQRP